MLVMIATAALFLVLAILFTNVKATFLIAGYNTMPPDEKAKYDLVALSKFMGKLMFGISGSIFLLVLGETLRLTGLSVAGTILVIAISLFALVYSSTGNRFRIEKPATQS